MTQKSTGLRGIHVLIILAGFFGTIFAVNGAFVYYALATHPGDDVQDAYAGGIAFNQELKQKAAQSALGWHAIIDVLPRPQGGELISIHFTDAHNAPLPDLQFTATARHPANSKFDHAIEFRPAGPGLYRAFLDETRGAQWDLFVEARSKAGQVFRMRHRL